jgi:hypothetical protein
MSGSREFTSWRFTRTRFVPSSGALVWPRVTHGPADLLGLQQIPASVPLALTANPSSSRARSSIVFRTCTGLMPDAIVKIALVLGGATGMLILVGVYIFFFPEKLEKIAGWAAGFVPRLWRRADKWSCLVLGTRPIVSRLRPKRPGVVGKRGNSGSAATGTSSWAIGAAQRPGRCVLHCAPPAPTRSAFKCSPTAPGSGSAQARGRLGLRCC